MTEQEVRLLHAVLPLIHPSDLQGCPRFEIGRTLVFDFPDRLFLSVTREGVCPWENDLNRKVTWIPWEDDPRTSQTRPPTTRPGRKVVGLERLDPDHSAHFSEG